MNINLSSPSTRDVLIKNLFSVFSADKATRFFGRTGLALFVRELAVSRDTLQVLFNDWKRNPGETTLLESEEENREMAFIICSSLMADETIHSDIVSALTEFALRSGINGTTIKSLLANRGEYTDEKSILKRASRLKLNFRDNGKAARSIVRKNGGDRARDLFIANQVSDEGFDEIQRMLMAYHMDVHAAIDGPPGTGKTHTVMETAGILGLDLFTKTCSSRTTESHIISYPVLSSHEGASVTAHVNGPLVNAMTAPGIFYGDEFNLLKEDVQKRLNSAFDERRAIDRSDGLQVKAKPGFWGVISYNPTQNFTSRDLEDSVADRFIHLHFGRWHPDFKAYVAHRKSAPGKTSLEDFGITLSLRGVSADGKFYSGNEENGKITWRDFFSGEKSASEPEYSYQVHRSRQTIGHGKDSARSLVELEKGAFTEIKFARMLSNFTDLLNSLGRTGKSSRLKQLGLGDALENEDLELLSLHESSARIEVAALRHYHYLMGLGCNRYLAQSYAVRLVIDQICYGQYRTKKLRNHTVYSLITMVARSLHLFADTTKYNTDLTKGR